MRTDQPQTHHRHDYQPYPFRIPEIALVFDLDEAQTQVSSRFTVERTRAGAREPLVLRGEALSLVALRVDGQDCPATHYTLDEDGTLTLPGLPDHATIEIVATCRPSENATLMGLYVSRGTFFTQCEAEGYRRITWAPDRPDVMSIYHVTLRADATRYPVLLSNGNLIAEETLPDGRLEARWHDPFPKPSYLFALVAGKLAVREQTHRIRDGREVLLQVYSSEEELPRTEWAMQSLVRALVWDESRFNLPLDLDRFMIVATHDFNMGAMENKGLNIFNAAYVLADPDTATDANYSAIEAVIGHEYFHNWTGNRVTCRDWFQLSLKEGLTVFRDQEFTADMMAAALQARDDLAPEARAAAAASARAVKRIDDVIALRTAQFPEDAGPMAHPIRPESYQEIGNFYTATIYEKGAEVIRMQHTLLGEATFQAGMATYFERHDGQAVTCDDFVAAMEHALQAAQPGRDLKQFRRWYEQAGTPRLTLRQSYDAAQQRFSLTLAQHCAPVGVEITAGVTEKLPLHIPVKVGFLADDGQALAAQPAADTPARLEADGSLLLELTEREQTWHFDGVASTPTLSLLRDFSAPVVIDHDPGTDALARLAAHDSNAFARWEALQELASRQLLAAAQGAPAPASLETLAGIWQRTLTDDTLDAAWRARALALPSVRVLAERLNPTDPLRLFNVRHDLRRALGSVLASEWRTQVEAGLSDAPYSPDPLSAGRRDLKHLALGSLVVANAEGAIALAQQCYSSARNMTDAYGALAALSLAEEAEAAREALAHFHARWRDNALVTDKWFALQASAPHATAATARALLAHPDFNLRTPNRARAVIFQFCLNNPAGLHAADGSGYAFWAEQVLALNALNPEVAARLARGLEHWARHVPAQRAAMQAAQQQVLAAPKLSKNVAEILSKSLEIAK